MRQRPLVVLSLLTMVLVLLWRPWREDRPVSPSSRTASDRLVEAGAAPAVLRWGVQPESESVAKRGELRGVARDADGAPVTGARVCAWCRSCNAGFIENRPRCVDSGSDGSFVLTHVKSGSYWVVASGGGGGLGLGAGGKPVEVDHGDRVGTTADVAVPEAEAEVSGVVRDALGGRLPHAEVRVVSLGAAQAPGASVGVAVRTDADGRFRVSVPPGWVRLIALAEGYAPADVNQWAPVRGVQLSLLPSSQVAGRVIDSASGTPVPHARIEALDASRRGQIAYADHAGEFTVTGLSPGTYQLRASTAGGGGAAGTPVTVAVADSVRDVVVPVARAVPVSGVLLVGNEPCAKGAVRLAPVEVEPGGPGFFDLAGTDAEGRVQFEGLRPGTYEVGLSCEGHPPQAGQPLRLGPEPRHDLIFRLPSGSQLKLLAVDPQARPVAGLWVTLRAVDAEPEPGNERGALTGADGRLVFRGIQAGDYLVAHRFPGLAEAQQLPVTVRAHQVQEVELQVSASGRMVVRVANSGGDAPTRSLTVTVAEPNGASVTLGTPQGGGVFRAGPLAPGDYSVTVQDRVNPPATHPELVSVGPGTDTHVSITYGDQSATIAGHVRDRSGIGMRDALVKVYAARHEQTSELRASPALLKDDFALTGDDGSFSVARLDPEAHYTVIATHPSGAGTARLDLVPGGKQDAELIIAKPGSLAGRLLEADGTPVGEFFVSVRRRGAGPTQAPRAFANPDGAWSLAEVGPGDLELVARDTKGRRATANVVLEPGAALDGIDVSFAVN